MIIKTPDFTVNHDTLLLGNVAAKIIRCTISTEKSDKLTQKSSQGEEVTVRSLNPATLTLRVEARLENGANLYLSASRDIQIISFLKSDEES